MALITSESELTAMNVVSSIFDNQPFRVDSDSLIPEQRPTPTRLKVKADYYEQVMLKHPKLSYFHSLAELYNAALLESDQEVPLFVPQPFLLSVNGRRYTPDVYLVRNGQRIVQEIKPQGLLNIDFKTPLEHFFRDNGMIFEVVSNESIFSRKQEAENWLGVIRLLITAQDYCTSKEEVEVFDKLASVPSARLDFFIDPGFRQTTFLFELAIFRMIHQGKLNVDLESHPIDFDTELSLCI